MNTAATAKSPKFQASVWRARTSGSERSVYFATNSLALATALETEGTPLRRRGSVARALRAFPGEETHEKDDASAMGWASKVALGAPRPVDAHSAVEVRTRSWSLHLRPEA